MSETQTAEQRVKAKWPEARLIRDFFYVQVAKATNSNEALSDVFTDEAEAWEDAARRLEGHP